MNNPKLPELDNEVPTNASPPSKPYTSKALEELKKKLGEITSSEERVDLAFGFMKKQLEGRKIAYLKDFWEARKLCLEELKDKVKAENRSALWNQFKEMTQEALQIREILDEENNFAAEQIELAIQALEQEVQKPIPDKAIIDPASIPDFIKEHLSLYQEQQNHLSHLNAFASRINALRKELVKTEMRLKRKNNCFQRLSQLGDFVFPKRKQLVEDLSQHFEKQVELFISPFSKKGASIHPLFKTRETIKQLQGLAKLLSLNSQAFNSTRLKLSSIWDEVKSAEKQVRHERLEHKNKLKETLKGVEERFTEFHEEYKKAPFGLQEADKKIDDIVAYFKTLEVSKDEWRWLKGQIARAKKPIQELQEQQEKEKKLQAQEEEKKRAAKVTDFLGKLELSLKEDQGLPLEELQSLKQSYVQQSSSLKPTKNEKQQIERAMRRFKDLLSEKKEQQILSLDGDVQERLVQLKELLKEKQKRKTELKNHIEELRLASGSSGLDFEKAMEYDQQLQADKQTLLEVEGSIHDLEKKIKDLKAQK